MNYPFILYDSIVVDGTLSATNTASGFNINHVKDYRDYTFWQAASFGTRYVTLSLAGAQAADCVFLTGHNLFTASAGVKLQSSTDGATWADVATITVTADAPTVKTFSSQSKQYWRLEIITASVAARIGIFLLGAKMEFPQFISAPWTPYDETVKADGYESEAGNLLGASVNYFPWKTTVKFRQVARSFLTGAYKTFWQTHARHFKPFAWVPMLDTFPEFVFWARIQKSGKYSYNLKEATDIVDNFDIMLEGVNHVL